MSVIDGLRINDEFGFVSAGIAARIKHPIMAKTLPADPCKTLRTENELLRKEVAQLRQQLADRDTPPPKPRVKGIDVVIASFLQHLQEAEYTTETGTYTIADLRGAKRGREYSQPRQVAMWLCRRICRHASLPMIAAHFNKADHTVVLHAAWRAKALLDQPYWADIAARVLRAFGESLEAAPVTPSDAASSSCEPAGT